MPAGYAREIESSESGVVVSVSGEVDIYTASELRADLYAALDSSTGSLIVDLSEVGFIDSTGLGVLIGLLRRSNEKERPLALVIPGTNIARIFALTGLDKVFTIVKSRAEAWRLAAKSGRVSAEKSDRRSGCSSQARRYA